MRSRGLTLLEVLAATAMLALITAALASVLGTVTRRAERDPGTSMAREAALAAPVRTLATGQGFVVHLPGRERSQVNLRAEELIEIEQIGAPVSVMVWQVTWGEAPQGTLPVLRLMPRSKK